MHDAILHDQSDMINLEKREKSSIGLNNSFMSETLINIWENERRFFSSHSGYSSTHEAVKFQKSFRNI